MDPPKNLNPNERVDLDLSSAEALAFMCVSALFCFLLILAYCYCHCYCTETGSWNLFKRQKPSSPLPLPLIPYRKAKEPTRGCVVCLNEFEESEAVKVIPACGHVFHPQCIDRWIGMHRSCPVCRCSEIYRSDVQGREPEGEEVEDEAAEISLGMEDGENDGQMMIRLERSRSWRYTEADRPSTGLRRSCSL